MKILNQKIPQINTYDPNNPQITLGDNHTAGILALQEDPKFDFDFWYCLFSDAKSFKFYKISALIDHKILRKIQKKNAYLVLDNTLEPFLDAIDSIYKNIVLEENIPSSQVILLTNMYDAKEYSDRVAKQLGIKSIRIFWYTVFEQDLHFASLYTTYANGNLPKTLQVKEYPKAYLNLNRRWRLHRPFLTTLLHGRNLLDKGYVSLGPCDDKDSWDYKWRELQHYFRDDENMLKILESYSSVQDLPPMYLDTNELHINRAESTIDTNVYYENSYFSVVSETTYFQKEWFYSARFLSEKAFKVIAMQHPFILVSVPNSLEIYRKMGYKTFDKIINESYDLEHDDGKRMLMIADEIERLSNLKGQELEKFILTAKDICQYNYNVLTSKKQFITEL